MQKFQVREIFFVTIRGSLALNFKHQLVYILLCWFVAVSAESVSVDSGLRKWETQHDTSAVNISICSFNKERKET